jgi:hypothetical protein
MSLPRSSPGWSINVEWLLGVGQTGSFRFYANVEALQGAVVVLN